MDESSARNRKEVIRKILQRSHDSASLSERTVRADIPQVYKMAIASFSSWQIALSCAGMPSRETMFPNDAEEVMQLIRQLCHAERSIKAQHIRRKQHPLYTAALKYFGSWFAALEAAGINSTQVNPRYGWDRDKIIEAILLRAVERRTLGATYVRPLSLKTAAVKEFGSWERALREAGLDPAEYIGQPLTECRQDCKHRKWDRQLATGHQRNSTTRNARQGTRSRFCLP